MKLSFMVSVLATLKICHKDLLQEHHTFLLNLSSQSMVCSNVSKEIGQAIPV